jgi:hypothetical protein
MRSKTMRTKFSALALVLVGVAASFPGSLASAATADSILANKKYAEAPCTRYGTPGCPYPSFGKRLKLPRGLRGCGEGMFKGQDGQCYPLLR